LVGMLFAPKHLVITDQTTLATGHWKNRCEIVSTQS
jgi:hypothetical protein